MKTIIIVIIVVILGFVGYNYATRPAAAPSQDIQDVVTDATSTIGTTYKISSTASLVEFRIKETVGGNPTTVIGTTTQIAGDIIVSPTTVGLGTIAINARTFMTDKEKRNGAIARFILKSEDAANEFIYFKPTSVTATSTTGDLTISGVTKPATFAITMIQSGNTLTGTASTTLKRSDFGLVMPTVESIANVSDSLTVTATIVANKVQ